MLSRIKTWVTQDQGMTTAEYAMGTVAAASLGGLLIKLLSSPEMQAIIWKLLQTAFGSIFN